MLKYLHFCFSYKNLDKIITFKILIIQIISFSIYVFIYIIYNVHYIKYDDITINFYINQTLKYVVVIEFINFFVIL